MSTPTKGSNWIIPGKLLVGQYPFPYSPIPVKQLSEVITHCFNLTTLEETKKYGYPKWNSIKTTHFPIPDNGLITDVEMADLLDQIYQAFTMKKSVVYVHCTAGQGRTGMVLACFLKKHLDMSADNALEYVTKQYNERKSKLHLGKKTGKPAPTISPSQPCQINFVKQFDK